MDYLADPGLREGADRVDPAEVSRVLQDAHRGMGDGRHERDDPRRVSEAPWSGLGIRAEPTRAEVVARLLREWKVRTGRIRAKAEPAPGSGRASRAMYNVPRQPGPRVDATACVWRRNLAPGSRA